MNPQKKTVEFHQSDTSDLNMAEVVALIATPARSPGKEHRILRMKQLVERSKLSKATLYVLRATDPTFPKKIQLSKRAVGYLESGFEAWLVARDQLDIVEK